MRMKRHLKLVVDDEHREQRPGVVGGEVEIRAEQVAGPQPSGCGIVSRKLRTGVGDLCSNRQ